MDTITTFTPKLEAQLPETNAILQVANLVLHPAVERVALSSSRGLGGRPRPDSDVDLSLVVTRSALPAKQAGAGAAALHGAEGYSIHVGRRGRIRPGAIFDERGC
jgi:hypothetical protein